MPKIKNKTAFIDLMSMREAYKGYVSMCIIRLLRSLGHTDINEDDVVYLNNLAASYRDIFIYTTIKTIPCWVEEDTSELEAILTSIEHHLFKMIGDVNINPDYVYSTIDCLVGNPINDELDTFTMMLLESMGIDDDDLTWAVLDVDCHMKTENGFIYIDSVTVTYEEDYRIAVFNEVLRNNNVKSKKVRMQWSDTTPWMPQLLDQ